MTQTNQTVPSNIGTVNNTMSVKVKNNKNFTKVLLLSDSHGRGLSDKIKNTLGNNVVVEALVKPNAKLSQIVLDLKQLTKFYNKNDYVIILGATNNFPNEDLYLPNTFEHIIKQCLNTNLIMCTIPYRYDQPELNNDIFYYNEILYDMVDEFENCSLFDINFYADKSDFTRSGLHLNYRTKTLISTKLSNKIKLLKEMTNDINLEQEYKNNYNNHVATPKFSQYNKMTQVLIDENDAINALEDSLKTIENILYEENIIYKINQENDIYTDEKEETNEIIIDENVLQPLQEDDLGIQHQKHHENQPQPGQCKNNNNNSQNVVNSFLEQE